MATYIELARRLRRIVRGAGRRAPSIAMAGSDDAGHAVDARIASSGPLYIGSGWFLIGSSASRPGASEFALFDGRSASTARYPKEET
ncbi:hypothetical protein [Burkholderia oklahomensis]|uniref:Uncharacterized protein n=2 Tax=Burkholderia oklahomensis TaxID=342113 RepID=A0AAI8BBU9_9BURK|nr:hypothetical protein [Burkholderia oklahomensis]AIO69358.1 hypothetical protein DM82_4063 [Burkholderia oklahomensis]AJX35309.1 hypothetical protein BG90_3965 [Burkholderia oklahomensis C6786]AOI40363.1 hypothetical protein WG70_12550 [Burkholderia oklahomensis EO147]AOI49992.1 hypothetical protein WI23_30340 [Burkholderia oklahomensis C6786]KUY53090.1 hypothetical protein WI23_23110 [Burkholderia oklahomensis C6786]